MLTVGRVLRAAVAAAGLLAAVAMVQVVPYASPVELVANTVAGLAMVVGGALAWSPGTGQFSSRCGLLTIAAGAAWFVDQFLVTSTSPPVVVVSIAIAGLWASFLTHAVATFPDGRAQPASSSW